MNNPDLELATRLFKATVILNRFAYCRAHYRYGSTEQRQASMASNKAAFLSGRIGSLLDFARYS